MEIDTNPYRSLSANIKPIEFEKFCMETLTAYAKKEGLKDFEIEHSKKVEAPDSTYQIDVLAEYTALGCRHKVIEECKNHTRNIERSVVTDLYAKTQSIGAQKSILISTSGFQSDAVKYAKAHGIALWQICDIYIKQYSNAASREISPAMMFQMEIEKNLPKYFMLEWDCALDYPYTEIFPTPEMYQEARDKARANLRFKRK